MQSVRLSSAWIRPLLTWFRREARDLPWRRTTDPYAIWVSEIMLQQTQVKTVIPYWVRWMDVFPDLATLASAELDEVYKLWAGLGYYSRARHLHAAAQILVERNAGQFPSDLASILDLPGIGRYTAGAICSIAHNLPTPILDGNVTRVLTRVFRISSPIRQKSTQDRLWAIATDIVTAAAALSDEPRSCSAINQALMELGATICRPAEAACHICPLGRACLARKHREITQLPNTDARPRTIARYFTAFVIKRGHRYLVQRRPSGVVNGQLWEFPNTEVHDDDGRVTFARQLLGIDHIRFDPLCVIKHTITRYRIRLDVVVARTANLPSSSPVAGKFQWLTLKELHRLPFPSAHARILAKILAA